MLLSDKKLSNFLDVLGNGEVFHGLGQFVFNPSGVPRYSTSCFLSDKSTFGYLQLQSSVLDPLKHKAQVAKVFLQGSRIDENISLLKDAHNSKFVQAMRYPITAGQIENRDSPS